MFAVLGHLGAALLENEELIRELALAYEVLALVELELVGVLRDRLPLLLREPGEERDREHSLLVHDLPLCRNGPDRLTRVAPGQAVLRAQPSPSSLAALSLSTSGRTSSSISTFSKSRSHLSGGIIGKSEPNRTWCLSRVLA